MKITDKVVEGVLQSMVEDAADIYISAFVNYMRVENGERNLKHPDAVKRECLDTMNEVTMFFCSDYGESLTGVEGKIAMQTLTRRARQAYEDGALKKKYRYARNVSTKPAQYHKEDWPCTRK